MVSIKLLVVFTLMVVVGLSFTAHRILELDRVTRQSIATENAARYSEALRAFRSVYTSEVVHRCEEMGIPVSEHYRSQSNTIPLPATLTKVLGERLGQLGETEVSLYSEHPFSAGDSALKLTAFQRQSIARFKVDPESKIHQFEAGPTGEVVRYAVADRMSAECVSCHNTHPDSPKTDWRVGDVRGVIEVVYPVGASSGAIDGKLDTTVWILVVVGIFVLLILTTTVLGQRKIAAHSQQMAEGAEIARRSVQAEMDARIAAEEAQSVAERRTLHVQRLESLGLLAGGVAHDFNNLLVSILGNTELAKHELENQSYAFDKLALVEQASKKAAELTQKLLDFAGDAPPTMKPIALNDCIVDLAQLLEASINTKVSLALELGTDLPLILGDQTRIEQILLNLVNNAAESMTGTGKQVVIKTAFSDGAEVQDSVLALDESLVGQAHVYLEVVDQGEGIRSDTLGHIFDPFFSTKGPGRGLGLSTILGIVRAHNGSLVVRTEKNIGTSFRIGFHIAP